MRHMSNLTSFSMVMVVLLLGVFIPSLPNLDDDADNMRSAVVMPVAPGQSVTEAATDQRRHRRSKRVEKIASVTPAAQPAVSESNTVTVPQSQVSPPLRA
jgi:hypothetical protein